MIFGFGKRKREEERKARERRIAELTLEREDLQTELDHLTSKLNLELKDHPGDRTSTLSRYPRRIVELKIEIDEIDRKIAALRKVLDSR